MISFELLSQHLENADITLVLKKTETGIAVSVLPKPKIEDKAKENLIPLIIKGTPQELDAEFINLVSAELTKTTGIITNIAEFEAQANEMKAKSEAEKKAKDAQKKLNEASKKALEGADKLLEEGKYDECQKAIDKALKDNAEYKPAKTLQGKLDKAKPDDNQVDIFNVIEEEEAKPTPQEGAPTPTPTLADDVPPIEISSEDILLPKSTEQLEQIEKLKEKQDAGELGMDEINEVANASPNVEVVTMPPAPELNTSADLLVGEKKPGIKPNVGFDNEPQNVTSLSAPSIQEPSNPEEDIWAKREHQSQQNNNNHTNLF